MKPLFGFFLIMIATSTLSAQAPAGNTNARRTSAPIPTSEADPDLEKAQTLATQFIDKAFAKKYRDAANMMNPNPPLKEKISSSELREQRMGQIQRTVDFRNKQGESRTWDNIVSDKFRIHSDRPPTEEFAEFTFWCTYPNGSKSSNRVTVIKKDGQMYIERFMY